MTVSTKLAGGFGVLISVLVAILIYHLATIHESVRTNRELSAITSRLTTTSTEQIRRIDQIEENAGKYRVTWDYRYVERFDELIGAFQRDLDRFAELPLSGREREEVDRLEARWEEYLPLAGRIRGLVGIRTQARTDSLRLLDARLDRLRDQTRSVVRASQAAMFSEVDRSARAARQAERISWGAVGAALVLSILISALIVSSIARSLRRLKRGTEAVAEGNFDYRLETRRSDEFADLADDFNIMTRRLGELDRAKRDFLSKVSHDLKTPLASMRETTGLLLEELPGGLNERQRRLLELNARSGRRLGRMIGQLLELSRMEAGAVEYEFEEHDLVEGVLGVLEEIEASRKERDLRIEADLPDRPLWLQCDGDRIRQVIENLLENAMRYSPDGGGVEVRVRFLADRAPEVPPERWRAVERSMDRTGHRRGDGADRRGTALVSVADSGPGVPDGEKEWIFERFYQGEVGRRRGGGGVGLGLTLCREVIKRHGGTIWVEDRPGGGSVFSFLLGGTFLPVRSKAGPKVALQPS